MIPPWINQTFGRDFFDQKKTLLELRTVTDEITGAAWKIPSVKGDSSNFLYDELLISGTQHVFEGDDQCLHRMMLFSPGPSERLC